MRWLGTCEWCGDRLALVRLIINEKGTHLVCWACEVKK